MANENGLVGGGQRRSTLDLTGSDTRALARVRHWIGEMLTDLGRAHVRDVIQVADELTSNAFEHADGPRAVHLSHRPARHQTTVEVDDPHPQGHLTLGRSRFGEATHRGHGLQIVDRLATAWGVRRATSGHTGKTVWAEIACPKTTSGPP